MNGREEVSAENESTRAPRPISLEAQETPDGRQVVPAEGSVWQFYFPAGLTPTEDQMRVAVGALGAVKTMQAGSVAYTGWDASVDEKVTDIVNFTGQSIVDASLRADTVENAKRADAFNERVLSEADRLASERAVELEHAANEKIMGFEQKSIDAEQRAAAAEGSERAALAEVLTLRQEVAEKSVLPDVDQPIIVKDVEGSSSDTITVRSEERKA